MFFSISILQRTRQSCNQKKFSLTTSVKDKSPHSAVWPRPINVCAVFAVVSDDMCHDSAHASYTMAEVHEWLEEHITMYAHVTYVKDRAEFIPRTNFKEKQQVHISRRVILSHTAQTLILIVQFLEYSKCDYCQATSTGSIDNALQSIHSMMCESGHCTKYNLNLINMHDTNVLWTLICCFIGVLC